MFRSCSSSKVDDIPVLSVPEDRRGSAVAVRCKAVDVPVVVVDAKETVEAPLLQCVDKVVDIPVVTQRLIPMVQTVLKTIEILQGDR